MTSRALLAALLATLLLLCLTRPGSAAVVDSVGQARLRAETDGVLLVLDLYASWCAPCQAFDKDLEGDEGLASLVDRIVLCRIDVEDSVGAAVADSFEAAALPTFVILDPRGRKLVSWSGYAGSAPWVALVEAYVEDPTPFEARLARYRQQPNVASGRSLAAILVSNGDYRSALPIYSDLVDLDPENADRYRWSLFRCMVATYDDGEVSFSTVEQAAERLLRDDPGVSRRLAVTESMKRVARLAGDMGLYAKYVDPALELCASSAEVDAHHCENLALDRVLYVENDPEKAIAEKRSGLPEGWQHNPHLLVGYASWCLNNRVDLAGGEALLRAGLADGIETSDVGKAILFSVVADLCRAQGETQLAVDAIEQAIELQPLVSELRDSLAVYRQSLRE
jgi:thioredoxin-like negative regulator of GroEL